MQKEHPKQRLRTLAPSPPGAQALSAPLRLGVRGIYVQPGGVISRPVHWFGLVRVLWVLGCFAGFREHTQVSKKYSVASVVQPGGVISRPVQLPSRLQAGRTFACPFGI